MTNLSKQNESKLPLKNWMIRKKPQVKNHICERSDKRKVWHKNNEDEKTKCKAGLLDLNQGFSLDKKPFW